MEALDTTKPATPHFISKKTLLLTISGLAGVCLLGSGCYWLFFGSKSPGEGLEPSAAFQPLKFKTEDAPIFAPAVIRMTLHALEKEGNPELNTDITRFLRAIMSDPKSKIINKDFVKAALLDAPIRPSDHHFSTYSFITLAQLGYRPGIFSFDSSEQKASNLVELAGNLLFAGPFGTPDKEVKFTIKEIADSLCKEIVKQVDEQASIASNSPQSSVRKFRPIAFTTNALTDEPEKYQIVYLKANDGSWTMFDDIKNVTKTKIDDKEVMAMVPFTILFIEDVSVPSTNPVPISTHLALAIKHNHAPHKYIQAFRVFYEARRRNLQTAYNFATGFTYNINRLEKDKFPVKEDDSKTLPTLIEEAMKNNTISYCQSTVADFTASKTALKKIEFIGVVAKADSVDQETAGLLKLCPKAVPIVIATEIDDPNQTANTDPANSLFVKARDGTWTSINDYENKAILGLKEADIVKKKATYILYHNLQ